MENNHLHVFKLARVYAHVMYAHPLSCGAPLRRVSLSSALLYEKSPTRELGDFSYVSKCICFPRTPLEVSISFESILYCTTKFVESFVQELALWLSVQLLNQKVYYSATTSHSPSLGNDKVHFLTRERARPVMPFQQHQAWYVVPAWGHMTSANALIVRLLQLNPSLVITYLIPAMVGMLGKS